MNLCPSCSNPLEATTGTHTWTCPGCQSLFTPCFSCGAVTSRWDGELRTCHNAACLFHHRALRQCTNCDEWSVPVGVEGPCCQNPQCATATWSHDPNQNDLALSVPPVPAPPRRVLPIDTLLDHIAQQSHFEERYDLKECVFTGGMGEVWRAYDRLLGREVAIKLTRPEFADNTFARAQFVKEAHVAGRLLHPNVLPVFDLGVNRQRRTYFTMRFVSGASLRSSLDAVALACATNLVEFPLQRVVVAFLRACHGVDFAHQHGVLHLDLKPDNVLVSGFHEVFVIDWGLARVENDSDSERLLDLFSVADTVVDQDRVRIIGTPGYMAPEQARGEFNSFRPATDVFGLGGILYHILHGAPPYRPADARDPRHVLQAAMEPQKIGKIRYGILPRGERIRPQVRDALEALETICIKALQRDPGQRYPCVEDLIIDLNEWLGQTGDTARAKV
jgi:serine/threonine-protein kinase